MRTRNILAALAATSALALTAGCSATSEPAAGPYEIDTSLAADAEQSPLRILLTNDDGWNADGIQATYKALKEAGYDVTMVAPAENQSGQSAGFEFTGSIEVTHPSDDPDVYAVSATPVGSLMFGLNEVFKDNPPDLVVSGTNVGTNSGADTNYSGTVGAAVVAAGVYRIPAIAVSTATSRDGAGAFDETANLVTGILADGIPQFPEGTVLNINYPKLADGATEPNGYVYAPMSDVSQAAIGYEKTGDTTYELRPGRSDAVPEPGSDLAELKAGNVTFTVLEANRTAPEADAAAVKELVAGLNGDPSTEPTAPAVPAGSLGSSFGS
ncbi:5'/3'-nucleotidase SurE [Tomitella fengzijianii]|uniref:5'/3'-nucleotidase SurE n=1 Tax=Tomitella fengzijianii TaxID=2597660 RepID=UPI00131C7751|nr:5'/3'-nucleotidase SurE [Tomitella fengzijianii]